jgi:hypothetical protein
MADGDLVLPFGEHRVRIPGALVESVPWAREVAWGMREDGTTVLAFVTSEIMPEEIVSAGAEVVASFAALMRPGDVRQLESDLRQYIERLPP